MRTVLALVGACLLVVTGSYHLTGLRDISIDLEGERRALTRAAWIIVAGLWAAAGFGVLPKAYLMFGAFFPLTAAAVLARMTGFKFPGVWLLGLAGALGIAAGR